MERRREVISASPVLDRGADISKCPSRFRFDFSFFFDFLFFRFLQFVLEEILFFVTPSVSCWKRTFCFSLFPQDRAAFGAGEGVEFPRAESSSESRGWDSAAFEVLENEKWNEHKLFFKVFFFCLKFKTCFSFTVLFKNMFEMVCLHWILVIASRHQK